MRGKDLIWSSVSVLGLLALAELAGIMGLMDLRFFPRPTAVGFRLIELLGQGDLDLLGDLSISLRRVFLGSLIAFPFAISLALAAELSPRAGAFFRPWIAFIYPLPKLALLPLFLVIFGLGEASKVALVALGVFFLVHLSAGQGVRRIMQSEYYDVALIYRIPLSQRIFKVLLRGAMPEIVNGLKMGLGYGLVMVIAAEFTASRRGIGVFLWNAWDQFRVLDLYCALLTIGFVGWAIFFVCSHAEARFSRYD